MKEITIQKIRIRNFLSFGNDPVELEIKNGVIFVTGVNKDIINSNNLESKNGVGKTTLLVESLSFAYFGETYRNINQDRISSYITNEMCMVEVWQTINEDRYYIVRSLNPSKLVVYKNDEEFNRARTIPQTNKDILQLLGLTKDIFTNTVVMSTGNTIPFLGQKDKSLKTKFIEGIIGLELFSKMYEEVNTRYKELSKTLDKFDITIKEIQKNIESDRYYEKKEDETKLHNIKELESEIESLKSVQPDDYSKEISEKIEKEQDLNLFIKEQIEKINKGKIKYSKLESDISHLKNDLSRYDTKKECSLCKRPFEDHSNQEMEQERTILNEKYHNLNDKLSILKTALSTAQTVLSLKNLELSKVLKERQDLQKHTEKYSIIEYEINSYLQSIENLKIEENVFTNKIKDQEKRLGEIKNSYIITEKLFKIEEGKKFICSPLGLKPVIIKKIINIMNDRLNFYLVKLKSPFICIFDEMFKETLSTNKGVEISYGNLSNGERMRLDFAMLFAFRDLRKLQSGVSINITIFDELLDSSIDSLGINDIIEMLKDLSSHNNESYYIISHRLIDIDIDGCEIINLVKENGITKIVA